MLVVLKNKNIEVEKQKGGFFYVPPQSEYDSPVFDGAGHLDGMACSIINLISINLQGDARSSR
jgi:hypothetical protein